MVRQEMQVAFETEKGKGTNLPLEPANGRELN
jgi:hypothetical protein